jgi:hypothetical protein
MNPDAPPQWGGLGEPQPSFQWKQLSTIPVRPITWVEYPFLQGSAFHLLAGIKNSGKGTWLASVAARATRGEFNPTGWPQRVLWLALGEDSYAIDVRPRIEVAGGDPAGVIVLDGFGFHLPEHAQQLDDQVREAEAAVVIIDPLGGTMGGRSTDNDSEVRPALAALNTLADQTGTMVFGVRHITNKASKRGISVLEGILGSSDWVNIPRAVLALLHDEADPQMRHLFTMTGNRGPSDAPGRMLRIEGVQVEGHEHDVAFARVVGESHKDPDELLLAKRARKTSRSDVAEAIVLAMLNETPGGSMESDTLDAEVAKRAGLAAKTIRNVRSEMAKRGLVKPYPEKDEFGSVLRWNITITNAGIALASDTNNSPLATPLTPTSSLGFSEAAPARVNAKGTGSGDLQGKTHIPSPNGYDSGNLQGFSNEVPANSQIPTQIAPEHNLQLGFGLNGPDPEENPDPEDPENPGSGAGKPNQRQYAALVSTEQMPGWEQAWHQRNGGGS